MDKSRAAAVAVALAAGLAHAQATAPAFAPPNLSESGVRALAAGCAMCHGTEGRPVAGSAFARLAGRSAASIV
ncbi:MAG: c-type cytochrome [Usitatibacter sp.]